MLVASVRAGHRRQGRALVTLVITLLVLGPLPGTPGTRAAGHGYGDGGKVLLIDRSERVQFHAPLAPAWLRQWRRFYTVREFGGPPTTPGQSDAFRITPAALHGVDLFFLAGFSGAASAGIAAPSGRWETRTLDYTLSPEELATLEAFVRGGGALLIVPRPMGGGDNLADLLARFGIDYRPGEAGAPGDAVLSGTVPARFAGRSYTVDANWGRVRLHALPAEGATAIAEVAGRPGIAVVRAGAGKVLFVGNPLIGGGNPRPFFGHATGTPILDEGGALFLDLLADAIGAPLLAPEEARYLGWEVRLATLERSLYSAGDSQGGPRRQGFHDAPATNLLQAAARGQRCDVGPGCVSWTITPEQRALLEGLAARERVALERFDTLERLLRLGPYRPPGLPATQIVPPGELDYAAVEREYTALADDWGSDRESALLAFSELYRQQGGTFGSSSAGNTLRAVLGCVALLGGFGLVAGMVEAGVRRRRRRRGGAA